MISRSRSLLLPAIAVQAVVLTALGLAFALSPAEQRDTVQRIVTASDVLATPAPPRTSPLTVAPLYDRPDFVSDEDLAAVLRQVLPRFPRAQLKPNFVEHAVRIWGVAAQFHDPEVLDGAELRDVLTDHGRYSKSWANQNVKPLLTMRSTGVAIRFGTEPGASVHHDHWLASLTEAGIALDAPVYGPGRRGATIANVLSESLRDFQLDETEVEWTAMAFGLWLPPTKEWTGANGRRYSFDLIVDRLVRGQRLLGVCSGTHRIYSLMLLVRLDDEFDILSDEGRAMAWSYLEEVRDDIIASQQADGQWPSNWADGAAAAEKPLDEEQYKQVIATGHHLEWLAIAPRALHPPDEQIGRAARWIIDATVAQTPAEIQERYTFFSHVGNALALWRNTHPADSGRPGWQPSETPPAQADASVIGPSPTPDAGVPPPGGWRASSRSAGTQRSSSPTPEPLCCNRVALGTECHMRFTKMHGAGNDYIYVDCFAQPAPRDPTKASIAMSDRHTGIGGDGLVLIGPSERADARMRMFNADGSESEMCGNAIRCVAKYLCDHGLVKKSELNIETGAGVLTLQVFTENSKVARPRQHGPPDPRSATHPHAAPR
jgi:hypothetical protein